MPHPHLVGGTLQSSPPKAMTHPPIWWAARCNHLHPKPCPTPLFGGRHVAIISTRSHAPPPYLVGGTLQSSQPEAMPHPLFGGRHVAIISTRNHAPPPYLVGGTLQSSLPETMPHPPIWWAARCNHLYPKPCPTPLFGGRHVAIISTRNHAPPPYLVGGTLQSSLPETMPHPPIWWAARCNHLYPKPCPTPLFGGRHVAIISTRNHAPPPYLVGGTLQSSLPETMPHPPIWWAARCNHLYPKPCPTPLFGGRHVAIISTRSHAPPPYLVGGTLQSSLPETMPHPPIWWAARCNHLYPKPCPTPLFGGRHVAIISTRSHAPPPYLVGGTLQSSLPEAMPVSVFVHIEATH